jgi:hypothetical protein
VTQQHQNGPVFVRRRLQPEYNSTTPYLPIFEDCHLHKPLLKKAIQKYQKMPTFSMPVPEKKELTTTLSCQPFTLFL